MYICIYIYICVYIDIQSQRQVPQQNFGRSPICIVLSRRAINIHKSAIDSRTRLLFLFSFLSFNSLKPRDTGK